MGYTGLGRYSAPQSRCYLASTLPSSPYTYYGTGVQDVVGKEWKGGEIAFLNGSASASGKYKIYIQTATSGTTATWKRFQDVFEAV